MRKLSPLIWFLLILLAIAVVALLGPEERSLGASVRIVYLHGAWVLAAELALGASALTGLLGLLTRREVFHRWSRALGWTGMAFWLTYLPLSLWAMQANWSGLFLAEPRFRLALTFAVVGLLLQGGLALIHRPRLTSLANLAFFLALRIAYASAEYIMHPPPSPIFSSGLWNVIAFFLALNLLAWLAAYFLTRWFVSLQK